MYIFRYKPPEDIFTASHTKNSCYCQKDKIGSVFTNKTCPPIGIFNTSTCNFGMPMLTSFPHFYLGDKSLIEQIDGLNPQKELHESYIDLHPVSFLHDHKIFFNNFFVLKSALKMVISEIFKILSSQVSRSWILNNKLNHVSVIITSQW